MPSSRGSSQPGIEPRSPALHVDSLPSEPPGKPQRACCLPSREPQSPKWQAGILTTIVIRTASLIWISSLIIHNDLTLSLSSFLSSICLCHVFVITYLSAFSQYFALLLVLFHLFDSWRPSVILVSPASSNSWHYLIFQKFLLTNYELIFLLVHSLFFIITSLPFHLLLLFKLLLPNRASLLTHSWIILSYSLLSFTFTYLPTVHLSGFLMLSCHYVIIFNYSQHINSPVSPGADSKKWYSLGHYKTQRKTGDSSWTPWER